MSDTPTSNPQNTNDDASAPQPGLQILTQYVRDLSFENPAAPALAPPDGSNPDVGVDANVNARKLAENDYEVGLKFTIEAKFGDTVAFIAELMYCGVFRLINIPENDIKPVLLIEAPRQLFPFARRILADVTRDGGYPPILLDPIDFLDLYRRGEHSETQEQAASPDDGAAH
jgi:preprotein translocase subunit SecB